MQAVYDHINCHINVDLGRSKWNDDDQRIRSSERSLTDRMYRTLIENCFPYDYLQCAERDQVNLNNIIYYTY